PKSVAEGSEVPSGIRDNSAGQVCTRAASYQRTSCERAMETVLDMPNRLGLRPPACLLPQPQERLVQTPPQRPAATQQPRHQSAAVEAIDHLRAQLEPAPLPTNHTRRPQQPEGGRPGAVPFRHVRQGDGLHTQAPGQAVHNLLEYSQIVD